MIFIFVGFGYLVCVFLATMLWAIGIYKTARVRQFAFAQLKGQIPILTSDFDAKRRRSDAVKFILQEIRHIERVMTGVEAAPDVNREGIDLVSVYILRVRLGIQTEIFAKLLAKSSSRIIEKYVAHLDDVKKRVESEASEFSVIDRQFIVQRFVSNLLELNQLIEPSVSLQPDGQVEQIATHSVDRTG